MEKKLVLELHNHNVYYVKNDDLKYYITVPKNISKTNMCIELKSKMDNYNIDTNDEIWVMENIKNTFSYIDSYNITLVLPILDDEKVGILEKMDTTRFDMIDRLLGTIINSAYTCLKSDNVSLDNQIILVNNDRYKPFINWFITRYHERVICKSLLELIQLYNVNATSYKKFETPAITYVVGSYNAEVDAPKVVKEEPEIMPQNLKPQVSSGFGSYWLLAVITIVVAGIVAFIAFYY